MSVETKTLRTMCPMNCHPTFCGMKVTVRGDELVEISGDRDNPDSEGFLCVRGRAAHEIIDNPKRLLHPMVRSNRRADDWQRVSWDDALARIAEGIESAGRDRVGTWPGHGSVSNDFGVFAHAQLAIRFANMAGLQWWEPAMICWGLGGLGVGLTGALEVNTKEDMSANADLIVLWGVSATSQPNTARHVALAKKRGARVIAIDVRVTEACRSAHEHYIVKPGSDAALALGIMHVIVRDQSYDAAFIEAHTTGFDALRVHLAMCTTEWAAEKTGLSKEDIEQLAAEYVATERAMILLSGSSMYKNKHGWQSSRAISCLPALTGKIGKPGAGLGPRHAGDPHGAGLGLIINPAARPPGEYIPNQMSDIIDGIEDGRLDAMLLFGTNFVSSFADANRLDEGFSKMSLVIGHDLFMSETMRRYADIVLPATSWLEDVGCKMTATHLYLMDQALPPPGEARSMAAVVRSLANLLGVEDFYPWDWPHGHVDAVLDHPSTGHATVESLRNGGGMVELNIGHVAHPTLEFPTASGKVEFFSQTAADHGLPPLPTYVERDQDLVRHPLELRMGRSINHFHSFYDHGRALPSFVKHDPHPELWISPDDAIARGIEDGEPIRIHNQRGEMEAAAKVTDHVPMGTVWIHDGWPGLNTLTDGSPAVPTEATTIFHFTVGQASYDAFVEVSRANP